MASFNKVILVGNLTRDPELRYTPQGTAVGEFGIAINRQWKGPNGEKKEEVCFVDCQAWARAAETITEYCKKGAPLFVEGRLKLDSWEGKDGQKRSRMRVVVENFQFLGAPSGRRAPAGPGQWSDNPASSPLSLPVGGRFTVANTAPFWLVACATRAPS